MHDLIGNLHPDRHASLGGHQGVWQLPLRVSGVCSRTVRRLQPVTEVRVDVGVPVQRRAETGIGLIALIREHIALLTRIRITECVNA
jgi:hypothetical protein